MYVSACDIFDCTSCSHRLKGRCPGCKHGNLALQADGKQPCAIQLCVAEKQINSCRDCTAATCPFPRNLEMVCPVRAHYEKKRCYARKMSDHFDKRQEKASTGPSGTKVSDKVITRLRWYLFALDEFLSNGIARVSSEDISHKTGVKDYLIRHDISQFGEFGRPSIGYDAAYLRANLARILHVDETKRIVWIGADLLVSNPVIAKRLSAHGFHVAGICDRDPSRFPAVVDGIPVRPTSDLADVVRESGMEGAVIAVDQDEAQSVADALVATGIRGILNLTSAVIVTPPGVHVRNVDIVAELFSLCYYCH